MKILHVISSMEISAGGPPIALTGMAQAQQRAGLKPAVVAAFGAENASPLPTRLRDDRIDVLCIGPCTGPLLRHPALAENLRPLIADADVIHIHGVWHEIGHVAATLAATQARPYLITPHGMLDRWCMGRHFLRKRLYLLWRLSREINAAAALHFTSEPEHRDARYVERARKFVVEPLGIEWQPYSAPLPAGQFRSRHGLDDRPIALFLGRLDSKKGLDLLIEAFARVGIERAVLVIAGPEGDWRVSELKSLARRHGIEGRVLFPGMLWGEEKRAAFADANCFVLPSHQENFGIAVCEALAAGTPVIISDRVNIHEQIAAAGVGSVVPLNVGVLAAAMTSWLGDPSLRDATRERAQKFVREHYDWDRIAANWVRHYEELVAAGA